MNWVIFFALVIWGRTNTFAANIFVLVPTPAFSHQQFYRTYILELHRRGHNLTVATPNPLNDPALINYKEIDLSHSYEYMKTAIDVTSETGKKFKLTTELLFFIYWKVVVNLCHIYLSDHNLMELYQSNQKFDLFVMEWGILNCIYPFEKLADGKMIGISSFELGSWWSLKLGNTANPSYVSDIALGYGDRMTFFQRLRSTIYMLVSSAFALALKWKEQQLVRQYFGENMPPLDEFERKVNLVMDNSHVTTSFPRPANPNFITLGGSAFHLHRHTPKALPKDLQAWMDSAEHGVVYFSLGTNVKTHNLPNREEKILMEAFRRIKQKVLWKWENDNLQLDLDNVKKSRWFPQVDILAHPKVVAFVTQGGLQSIGEAVEYHVPMVVMPFFADQGHNAKKMESVGVAVRLDFDTLSPETLVGALNEVIYNKTYKENAVKYSELVKDQPMPPLEKAVWWTEYVIRHKGTPHLRSIAASMPWYRYMNVDVLLTVLAASLLVLYLLCVSVRWLFRFAFGSVKVKTSRKTKKSKKE